MYQRYIPYGPESFARFLDAYQRFDAGIDHNLVVINHYTEGGSDLHDYRTTIGDVTADAYCFLNCYSEPLCDGWLSKLAAALDDGGIVGATGSYEKAIPHPHWEQFESAFPNPHIRSNAFMLKRDTALALEWKCPDKESAWMRECGPNGLTRQVTEKLGLAALMVGRDAVYSVEDWPTAHVYRCGEQENLLVADNRTCDYQHGSPQWRRKLAKLAWG